MAAIVRKEPFVQNVNEFQKKNPLEILNVLGGDFAALLNYEPNNLQNGPVSQRSLCVQNKDDTVDPGTRDVAPRISW